MCSSKLCEDTKPQYPERLCTVRLTHRSRAGPRAVSFTVTVCCDFAWKLSSFPRGGSVAWMLVSLFPGGTERSINRAARNKEEAPREHSRDGRMDGWPPSHTHTHTHTHTHNDLQHPPATNTYTHTHHIQTHNTDNIRACKCTQDLFSTVPKQQPGFNPCLTIYLYVFLFLPASNLLKSQSLW